MTQTTFITTTCDKCHKQIPQDEKYLNVGAYGVHFHIKCAKEMTGWEMVAKLSLDAQVMIGDDWESAVKAPRYIRQDLR